MLTENDDVDGTGIESESGEINSLCLNKSCTPVRLRRRGRGTNVSSAGLTEQMLA